MQGQTRQPQRGASTRTLIRDEGTTFSHVSKLQLSEVPTSGASRAAVVSTSRFDGFDCTVFLHLRAGELEIPYSFLTLTLSLSNAYFATINFADVVFYFPHCNPRGDSVGGNVTPVSPMIS